MEYWSCGVLDFLQSPSEPALTAGTHCPISKVARTAALHYSVTPSPRLTEAEDSLSDVASRPVRHSSGSLNERAKSEVLNDGAKSGRRVRRRLAVSKRGTGHASYSSHSEHKQLSKIFPMRFGPFGPSLLPSESTTLFAFNPLVDSNLFLHRLL